MASGGDSSSGREGQKRKAAALRRATADAQPMVTRDADVILDEPASSPLFGSP